MWINDTVYLKKELEVLVQTKNRKITIESELYLELEVIGELNYSINPEYYAFPNIEISSKYIYKHFTIQKILNQLKFLTL